MHGTYLPPIDASLCMFFFLDEPEDPLSSDCFKFDSFVTVLTREGSYSLYTVTKTGSELHATLDQASNSGVA